MKWKERECSPRGPHCGEKDERCTEGVEGSLLKSAQNRDDLVCSSVFTNSNEMEDKKESKEVVEEKKSGQPVSKKREHKSGGSSVMLFGVCHSL